MLLAADIGGTKVQIAFYSLSGLKRPKFLKTYPTKDFPNLLALLKAYISQTGIRPKYASLAVAGTIVRGKVSMVNLGWEFSKDQLKKDLSLAKIFLLNDLEALAFAVPHIKSSYVETIYSAKRDPQGNIGVIAAGTGLGQAMLIRHGAPYPIPVATEAGHAEFCPCDELEWALYKWLSKEFSHVSLERVISGPGIENIYRFLCERKGISPKFSSPKEISDAALGGKDLLAKEALNLFVRAYAREAASLALRCLATGGIFIGGGIAPKIIPFLKSEVFLKAFLDKGRLSSFISKVPVKVITHPYPVLLGAALYGCFHLSGQEHSNNTC